LEVNTIVLLSENFLISLLRGLRGLFIALLQVPPLGFRFLQGNLHGYPYDRDITGDTQCPLHVWAPIRLNSSANLFGEITRKRNGPLGLLTVGFGTWRSPCLRAKAFTSPSSPMRPSDEVFAWRSPRVPSHGFRHVAFAHMVPFDLRCLPPV
jgi:hypothetical protein